MSGKEQEQDPLSDPLEGMNDQERKNIELNMTLARQAQQFSGMMELIERIQAVRERAEEKRDSTFGDEHFVWMGHCIALRDLLKNIGELCMYQPPKKEGKRAASYL